MWFPPPTHTSSSSSSPQMTLLCSTNYHFHFHRCAIVSVHHCAAKTPRPDLRGKTPKPSYHRIISRGESTGRQISSVQGKREREGGRGETEGDSGWKKEHKRRIHPLLLTILWKNHDGEDDASDGAEEGRHDWSVTSGVCVCVCVSPSHLCS